MFKWLILSIFLISLAVMINTTISKPRPKDSCLGLGLRLMSNDITGITANLKLPPVKMTLKDLSVTLLLLLTQGTELSSISSNSAMI